MASDMEHLRHCVLCCISIEKNEAQAIEMITALGEGAMTHKTCKKWFHIFRNVVLTFPTDKDPVGRKIRRRGTEAIPGGESYSNGKRTCIRSRSYLASNFPSLASTRKRRKNSKGRPMVEGTEFICITLYFWSTMLGRTFFISRIFKIRLNFYIKSFLIIVILLY